MAMRVTFRLNPERDNDLIGWLDKLPDDPGRSYAIRQALRGQLKGKRAAGVSVEHTPFEPEQADPVVITDGIATEVNLESKLDSLF